MQKLSGVNNQTIQDMAVMAKTMGASNENVEKLIQGAIGLEKTLGINAASAMRYLTLAVEEGDYSMLNRYIPSLRTLETETEKQTALNNILSGSWDLATDRMNTTAGAFENISNVYTDESEKIGDEIKESLGLGKDSFVPRAIQAVSKFFRYMLQGLRGIGTNIGIFVYNAKTSLGILGQSMGIVSSTIYNDFNVMLKALGSDFKSLLNFDFDNIGSGISDAIKKSFTGMSEEIGKIWDDDKLQKFDASLFEIKETTDEVTALAEAKAAAEAKVSAAEAKAAAEAKRRNKLREDGNKLLDETIIKTKKLKEVEDNESAVPDFMQEAIDKKAAFDMEVSFQKTMLDNKLINQEEYLAAVKALNESYGYTASGVVKPEIMQSDMDMYTQMWQNTYQLANQLNQMSIQDINQERDAKIAALDEQAMSSEEYEKAVLKIQKAAEKEKKKINKRQQKLDVASATANTALAIMEVYKDKTIPSLWMKFAMAGLVGAIGAAQIATIASQKFATGGYVSGKGSATSDSIPANLSNGEFVNTANTVSAIPRTISAIDTMQRTGQMPNLASAINADTGQRGGGSTVIQPTATAVLELNANGLAVRMQQELNQMENEGTNLRTL